MGDPLIVSGGEAVSFGDVPFGPMRLSLRGTLFDFETSAQRHSARQMIRRQEKLLGRIQASVQGQ